MIYSLKCSKIHQYHTQMLYQAEWVSQCLLWIKHLDEPWGFFVLLLFVGVLFLFGCISHFYLLEASQHLTNKFFKEWIILYFIHGEQRQKSKSRNAHALRKVLSYWYLELPFFHGSHLHSERPSCGCTSTVSAQQTAVSCLQGFFQQALFGKSSSM